MISQPDLGGRGIVYQVIGNARHHHLVCFNGDKAISLGDSVMDGLRGWLRSEYNFEPRIDHLAILGLGEECQEQLVEQ
jgi:Fe2+ or Zn2+ uptake regulation protein